jgi:O-antigen/teichoic acid export membrane protein
LKSLLTKTNINLFINVLNQVLGIGFPILIQFYTIRHFNISDLGYLNLLNSYWAIFTLGLSFFNFYLLKVFASKKNEEDVKAYLTNATVLMYAFISIPFVLLLIYLYFQYPQIIKITLLTSLPVITSPLSFEIYFQATLKNSYILIRRFIVRVLFIVLMLWFAKTESDYIIYVYIFCLSFTAENLINLFIINKYISIKLINLKVLKDILKNSLSYLAFNLTYNLMPNLSIIGASSFISIDQVTIYSVLIRIINLATSFITSAVMVLYPIKINHTTQNGDDSFKDKKYLKNTFIVSLVVGAGLIATHKIIFFAFLENYKVDHMLAQFSILTSFIVCHSVYNYITFNYYFIKDRTIFISIVNVVLLLIYFIELIFVKFGVINFNFSVIYILPYPFALALIFYDVRNNNKLIQ